MCVYVYMFDKYNFGCSMRIVGYFLRILCLSRKNGLHIFLSAPLKYCHGLDLTEIKIDDKGDK